ncbi:MAG: 4Fe-4S binding protein [Chloroflexi bacterium]|nr:4Fe-4S binding protein [Chloroflexota bacterium]
MNRASTRRALVFLERATLAFENLINLVATTRYNPLYHTGTLAVWLLTIVAASGILLLVIYFAIFGVVPDAALVSIERLNDFWLGRLARSVHRYAADLSVVFIVLHALRMFVADRFSGSRWFAWVTGLALLATVLAIGVLGVCRVGDVRAQWIGSELTRLLGGPTALTYLTNETLQKAFYLFYAILVFHIGLGLIVAIGFWLHTMRLSRARVLPPRVWVYAALTGLGAVVLIRPAALPPSADLGRTLGETPLDPFFLLFLPALQNWGAPMVVGASAAGLGVAALLPWLFPRRVEKATVLQTGCTGCQLCANDCPYGAIEMRPRSDNRPYKLEAVVNPSRCVGCGICVGACGWDAIRVGAVSTLNVQSRLVENAHITLACERHTLHGALASTGENIIIVPCIGALHPDLIHCAQQMTDAPVALVGCLHDDCSNREGSRWLAERLSSDRPPYLSKDVDRRRLHAVWIAPDDGRELAAALRGACRPQGVKAAPNPTSRARWLPGIALFAALVLAVAAFADVPYQVYPPDVGFLKIALAHGGEFRETAHALSSQQMSRLPQGVTPEQVLGAARFPVALQVSVDGDTRLNETFPPTGLRQDGLSYALQELSLPAGDHTVEIRMDDRGGQEPRLVFDGTINVPAAQVRVLSFDAGSKVFVVR